MSRKFRHVLSRCDHMEFKQLVQLVQFVYREHTSLLQVCCKVQNLCTAIQPVIEVLN